jgi:hypothetical protein
MWHNVTLLQSGTPLKFHLGCPGFETGLRNTRNIQVDVKNTVLVSSEQIILIRILEIIVQDGV